MSNMTGSGTLEKDDHFVLTCHWQYVGNESAPIISWNEPGSNTSSCVIIGLNATMFLRATTIGAFFSCVMILERPGTHGDDNLVSTCNCTSAALNQTCSYSIAFMWHCKYAVVSNSFLILLVWPISCTPAVGGLFVCEWVCVWVSESVSPRTCRRIARRMMNDWLWNFYKYVGYNTANNVSTFGGDLMTQLIANVYQMIKW